MIDNLLCENENLKSEAEQALKGKDEAEQANEQMILKLDKAMAMISELKSLKTDVM